MTLPTIIPGPGVATGTPVPTESFLAAQEIDTLKGSAPELSWAPAENYLENLTQESHADLFYRDLLSLGRDLEAQQQFPLASTIYQYLSQNQQASSWLRQSAESALAPHLGEGPLGGRLELWTRQAIEGVMDPAMIAGMGVGALAFRAGRLLALRPLVNGGRAGLGVRSLATGAGVLSETVAFTGAMRGFHALSGHNQDWSLAALGHETAATALLLGSLRLVGGPVQYLARGNPHAAYYHLAGTYGGIVLGHGLGQLSGFQTPQSVDNLLVQSAVTLVQFQAAGHLLRTLGGRRLTQMESTLDQAMARLEHGALPMGSPRHLPNWIQGPELALANGLRLKVSKETVGSREHLMMMSSNQGSPKSGGSSSRSPFGMGMPVERRPALVAQTHASRQQRVQALLAQGRIGNLVNSRQWVSDFLDAHGITTHAMDMKLFYNGFCIAKRGPQRVDRMAWDMDEVLLHWSMGLPDAFRGLGAKKLFPPLQNTPEGLLNYEPFRSDPDAPMGWGHRFFYRGLQALFPTRMRQHIQFHPGMRAFLLGLKMGSGRSLILTTTGPAGRILLLANEDPAFKQIFFSKLPNETVSIEEVRNRPNVYTREDIALGLRSLHEGEVVFPQDPLVRDYLRRLQENPQWALKLKHPALARLRGKRPFAILIDDSATAFQAMRDLPDFAIIKPPSARPKSLLNFTFGSPHRYLDRMNNGYGEVLSELLFKGHPLSSQELPFHPSPADYIPQRFVLEMPWSRFGAEFHEPAAEILRLARETRNLVLPNPGEYPRVSGPLRLRPHEGQVLVERLEQEVQSIIDGTGARVKAAVQSGPELQRFAQNDPVKFRSFLRHHLHPSEIQKITESQTPIAERSLKFFSTLAGIVAAKKSALHLLGLEESGNLPLIEFHYGQTKAHGEVAQALGRGRLLTSQSSDGELGAGIALWEPRAWGSGLGSIGIDITTARMRRVSEQLGVSPTLHAMSEAAYKATLERHRHGRFAKGLYREVELYHPQSNLMPGVARDHWFSDQILLSGQTGRAALSLLGEASIDHQQLFAYGRNFQVGEAIVALAALPSHPQFRFPEALPQLNSSIYRYGEDGRYHLNGQPRVAVLGDIGGGRTFDVAREGGKPTHIDFSDFYLRTSQRGFQVFQRKLKKSEAGQREIDAEWLLKNWYDVRLEGDAVEGLFPLSPSDLPKPNNPAYRAAVRDFMTRALHTKVHSQGHVFVISEIPKLIRTMSDIAQREFGAEILDFQIEGIAPPLRGGHNTMDDTMRKDSWVLYRLNGE